eukprot:gene786-4074_t
MTDTKSGERRVAGSATSTPTATVAAACGVGRSDGAGNGSYESNSQNDLCNHGVVEEVTGFDELDSDEEDFKEQEEPFSAPIETRIFKMGWMKKKGGGKVQRGRHQGKKAIGWVNIREGVNVAKSTSSPTDFTLTTDERTYSFSAPTVEAADEWISLLLRSINRAELEG